MLRTQSADTTYHRQNGVDWIFKSSCCLILWPLKLCLENINITSFVIYVAPYAFKDWFRIILDNSFGLLKFLKHMILRRYSGKIKRRAI